MSTAISDQLKPRAGEGSVESIVGLHGHPLEKNMLRAGLGEGLGTFVLVLTITSVAIAASLAKPVAGAAYGSAAVSLAGWVALAGMVAALGHVSGAHLNPAITLGLALNRRFPWPYVPVYVITQLTGAVAAALTGWALFGAAARRVAHLGATYPAAGVGPWRAFGAEAVVTFILALVVISVATDSRVPAGVAAVAIGAALASAILVSGPISGAGVNPARSLGPMIVAGKFTAWWVYVTAPVAGGALAATVYERVLRTGVVPAVKTQEARQRFGKR